MDSNLKFEYEDFVNQFQNWFESCGLKADLKTYVRTKIVDSLQSTNLGDAINQPNVSGKSKNSIVSPKLQAINYLIAEYLLKQKFGYTFSVFSSELTAFDKNFFANFLNNNHKFTKHELIDIMETLSIGKSKKVVAEYFKNDEPFLVNYFRDLSSAKHAQQTDRNFNNELDTILRPLDKNHVFFNELKTQLVELFESHFLKNPVVNSAIGDDLANLKEAYGNLILENDALKKKVEQLENNMVEPMNDFGCQTEMTSTTFPPLLQLMDNRKKMLESNQNVATNSSIHNSTATTSSSSSDGKYSSNIRKTLKNIHKKYDNIVKMSRNAQLSGGEDDDYSSIVQPFDSLTLSSDLLNSNKTDF